MTGLLIVPGVLLILLTLWDAFETMILPRRVQRTWKLARWYFQSTWVSWKWASRGIRKPERRQNMLSFYGPLSLIGLFAVWAILLILAYAMVYRSTGFEVTSSSTAWHFGTDIYFSGTTFFTLGLGDVASGSTLGRLLTVTEAGVGFAFLAMVIGYLPVLYQAFSRREVAISMLDARAGSPPTAMGLFRRYPPAGGHDALFAVMSDWERWAAELLESHLSYPLLAYFRSQHDRQSWVAALCMMLDVNAVLVALHPEGGGQTPQLVFAIARHAAVDLDQLFGLDEVHVHDDRLPDEAVKRMRRALGDAWPPGSDGDAAEQRLKDIRRGYEPHMQHLSESLLMPLPTWFPDIDAMDDWESE
ncbi:MAG: potassium channel family protein [Tepidiformaceae bacterium]